MLKLMNVVKLSFVQFFSSAAGSETVELIV